jgi:hypothetical protein
MKMLRGGDGLVGAEGDEEVGLPPESGALHAEGSLEGTGRQRKLPRRSTDSHDRRRESQPTQTIHHHLIHFFLYADWEVSSFLVCVVSLSVWAGLLLIG